jgi:glycosyltransferase involved in cell wall biosynthesis
VTRCYVLVAGDFMRTGGMDRANLELATYLAGRGSPVHLVTHRADDSLKVYSNVTVHPVPRPAGSNFLGEQLLDLAGRRVASALRPQQPVVLGNGGNCGARDVNWVHYVHAAWQDSSASIEARAKSWVFLRKEALIVPRCRLVFANSERTRRDLIECLRVAPKRVHVVHYGNASSVPTAAQGSERPRVAFVGAMSDRRKGFDLLFAAWTLLCKDERWDADLLVIGAGREAGYWEGRAAAAKLGTRMQFLGFQHDVPAILRSCDALVAPTRYEAFGLAVQESLCEGIPALVTRAAGVAELYPPELAGLLIADPEDVAGLVTTLRHWREQRHSYRQAVAPFAARLRAYRWSDMAQKMTFLMESSFEGGR